MCNYEITFNSNQIRIRGEKQYETKDRAIEMAKKYHGGQKYGKKDYIPSLR